MALIVNPSFGLGIIFHLFVGKKWSNIGITLKIFAFNNVTQKFEKTLCIETSVSAKDRVEFKIVMFSAYSLMENIPGVPKYAYTF